MPGQVSAALHPRQPARSTDGVSFVAQTCSARWSGSGVLAFEQHDRIGQPFARARTLLVRGILQRRSRHKREARTALEEALAGFERLGAALWAERARTELRRVGGRQRSTSELTPTEERVAILVAEGQTNREVAAALFMSVRTIEWNLAKVYRKLGVRSRTELAARYRGRPPTYGEALPTDVAKSSGSTVSELHAETYARRRATEGVIPE